MSDDTGRTDPDLAGLATARALAHPSRQAIRGALEAAPAGLSAPELARCVGLKHNVVRKHLRLMQAGGLVEVVAARPSGRGRPAVRFRLVAQRPRGPPRARPAACRDGRRLGAERGRNRAVRVPLRGRDFCPQARDPRRSFAYWRSLASRPRGPMRRPTTSTCAFGRCPFAEAVSARGGQLVCILHRGLSAGLADERTRAEGGCARSRSPTLLEGRCRVVMEAPTPLTGPVGRA